MGDIVMLTIKTYIEMTYTGRSTNLCQQLEFLLFHNPTQSEISNHNVRIFVLRTEQQVLGLEILNNTE